MFVEVLPFLKCLDISQNNLFFHLTTKQSLTKKNPLYNNLTSRAYNNCTIKNWHSINLNCTKTNKKSYLFFLISCIRVCATNFPLVWILMLLGCRRRRRRLLRLRLFLLFIQFFDGLNLLLQFHPAILEPYFDLAFCET